MLVQKDILKIVLFLVAYDDVSKHYHSLAPLESSVSSQFSSVWCHGSSHNDRVCRFENICYRPASKEFVFFRSSLSYLSGVPDDRFSPALASLSSVPDHNRMYFNYVEVPAENRSNFEISQLSGCTLILKRFNPENVMHVFHDDLLPIFYTLREYSSHFSPSVCQTSYLTFADDRPQGNYSLFYDMFFHTKPVFLSHLDTEKIFCFQHAIVSLNKYTTWYQYGFKQPQGSLTKDYSGMATVTHQFADYVREQLNIAKSDVNRNCAVMTIRKQNRKILNIDDLAKEISQTRNVDVIKVALEDYNIVRIIQLISQCNLLIGIHGSLLVLALFLSPGSTLFEIFPYAIQAKYFTPYRTLASFSGMSYVFWENKVRANSVPHPGNTPESGGIAHLPFEEQERIKNITVVSPPVCCYNPEWLYYIYQDTYVDVNSFMSSFGTIFETPVNSITKMIKPGQVLNLSCYQKNPDAFHVTWDPPWNIQFMNYAAVEYEIWVQPSDGHETAAYITKRSHLMIKWTQSLGTFYIWVRCSVDNSVGPFNDDPMSCLDA